MGPGFWSLGEAGYSETEAWGQLQLPVEADGREVRHIETILELDDALVIERWPVSARDLAAMVGLISDGTISGKIAKTVFEEMVKTGDSPAAIVESKGLVQVTDEGAIREQVRAVLDSHPDKVEEFRGGKDKLLGFFVGQVMKASQGKANPKIVNEILRSELAG